ncbi:MAG: 50S ribosomal protein L10 [Calditrichaeota bacterium]|nr:50S ribosomal protein L10 [Calditrichota bacterium]
MPTPQKEQIVQEMTDKFSRAQSIILADFTGIDVNTITELRKKFREANVEYRVVKNTLARLSVKNAGIEGLEPFLVGVNSYAISYDDPTKPIKVIEEFKKELEDKFQIKAAYFEGKIIGPEQVPALAKLPSRDELLAQFVGMLNSPMSKLVGTLQGAMTKLIGVLKALEESKK